MLHLLEKYARKAEAAGLALPGTVLLAGLDDRLECTHDAAQAPVLVPVLAETLGLLGANSLMLLPPAEPYATILAYLTGTGEMTVVPSDCETRTFLHDLPVVTDVSPQALADALGRRKAVIVPGVGVLAHGSVSPEQAFVSASSVCFACFVKFFGDFLDDLRRGTTTARQREAFARARTLLPPPPGQAPELPPGPYSSREDALRAMCLAGRATVEMGLVDSFFGNISCLHRSCPHGDVLHISQTGSSLDELEHCVDPCPMDGSTCASLTASSEYTAHKAVVERTGATAILHGHPRFSVILSMDCEKTDCAGRGRCHLECPETRSIADIPVVPGEVGTGPRGLVNTLPGALAGRRGAIVHGHGLFAASRQGFRECFDTLLDVERFCREEYFRRVRALGLAP